MSQPTPAYHPAPGQQPGYGVAPGAEQPVVPAFRPASGWQFGDAPLRVQQDRLQSSVLVLAAALAALGLLLHGVQGIATVAPLVDLDGSIALRVLTIWMPSVALISLGVAISTRSVPLIGVVGGLVVLLAIGIAVFGSMGTIAWWESFAIIPVLLAIAGAVAAVLGTVSERRALAAAGEIAALVAVVLHTALVVIGPLATNAVSDVGAFLISALPTQLLGVAAIVVLGAARTERIGIVPAAVVVALLGIGIVVGPIVAALQSVEPNVGTIVVAVLRLALLLAAAGILLVRSARA